jgi:hypothetical protein
VDHDFDLSKVKAEITGPSYDLYITVGIRSSEDLGSLKAQLDPEMAKSKVLNLDNDPANTKFGSLYVIDPSMESLCLLTLNKAPKWDLIMTAPALKAISAGVSL